VSNSIQELEALTAASRWVEAGARCTELCHQTPGDPRLWFIAARIERQLGHAEQALTCYRKAAELAPHSSAVLFEYGIALQATGDVRQAIAVLQKLVQREPGNPAFHQALGGLYSLRNQLNEAKQYFEQALRLKPDMVEALLGLCTVWNGLDRPDEVLACLQKAISLRPQAHELYFNLGLALENLGRLEEAYLACERTIALKPDHYPAIALQAGIRRRQSRYEEAVRLLDPLLSRGVRHPRIVDAFVNLCHKVDRCDEALTLARVACATPGISEQDSMCLHFSTGQALDRLGRYDEAFEHFRKANQSRQVIDDVSGLQQLVEKIIEVHDTDPGAKQPDRPASVPKLIFIIGMPRSGTTLVEQILSSHPDVYGAGELTAMNDVQNSFVSLAGTRANYPHGITELDEAGIRILRQAYLARLPEAGRGATVVTDKQPGNFLAVGLIRTLFPEASIVHCTRNALDTCLSSYFNNFSGLPYTFDLTLLGKTWRIYQRLMQHWQKLSIPMLELSYEATVNDTEGVSRALIEYCGLEWNDACLRFHENKRIVATVSHDQVNRPIYKGSVERWRHYEKHLGPLIDALKDPGKN